MTDITCRSQEEADSYRRNLLELVRKTTAVRKRQVYPSFYRIDVEEDEPGICLSMTPCIHLTLEQAKTFQEHLAEAIACASKNVGSYEEPSLEQSYFVTVFPNGHSSF